MPSSTLPRSSGKPICGQRLSSAKTPPSSYTSRTGRWRPCTTSRPLSFDSSRLHACTKSGVVVSMGGAPVWFQLYPTRKWEVAEALVRRAERAGSPVIVVTVDGPAPVNWETLVRLRRTDTRQCDGCHGRTFRDYVARKPNFDGINVNGIPVLNAANLTWDSIKRIPVLVDSGFRRGTDINKGLAMGAQAVCIGRPYLWGLGAFGQPGVERVLDLLHQETRAAMMQVGAPSLKQLVPAMVRRAS